jgi:hypothetical protein
MIIGKPGRNELDITTWSWDYHKIMYYIHFHFCLLIMIYRQTSQPMAALLWSQSAFLLHLPCICDTAYTCIPHRLLVFFYEALLIYHVITNSRSTDSRSPSRYSTAKLLTIASRREEKEKKGTCPNVGRRRDNMQVSTNVYPCTHEDTHTHTN